MNNGHPGKLRLFIQAAFFALTNSYIEGFAGGKIYKGPLKKLCVPGLNCYSCPGARFSCPIGSLQAVLDSGQYRMSLYVLGMMSVFGILLGRVVCGFLCPFGLVQDLLYRIPVFRKKQAPGKWAKRKNLLGHRLLLKLKYLVLLFFVIVLPMTVTSFAGMGDPWFCKYICPSGTLAAGLPLLLTNESLRGAAGILFGWKALVLFAIILLSVAFYRPFCKYLCPLGAFYGFFNRAAFYRLEVNEEKCIRCGKCQAVCGMDIRTFETPNSMECIRCGACLSACPTDAISSSLSELMKGIGKKTAGGDTVCTKSSDLRS
ncbi:MAG: 4Fe-4S binding protein [Eubacteriales bacterium]|nr:4Fe-4S binding protein [Eubacteriales bacterium]